MWKTDIVTADYKLRRTGRECRTCEDGEYLKDGHELVCDNCGYAPTFDGRRSYTTPWQKHRKQIDLRLDGTLDGRPRMVGGYKDAYWGEGDYCFTPTDGFTF